MKPLEKHNHPEHCWQWTKSEVDFINNRVSEAVHEYESKTIPSLPYLTAEIEELRNNLAASDRVSRAYQDSYHEVYAELKTAQAELAKLSGKYSSDPAQIRATFEKDEEDDYRNYI